MIEVNDIQMCVWEWAGDSTPVLFSHATGFHGRCWDEVVKQLPDNTHVLAVETRFHGRTSKVGEVCWDLFASDMMAVIQQLDLNDIVAVGHSQGGYLMAQSASQLPDRFKHLILVDPVIMPPERYAQINELYSLAGDFEHPTARRRNEWSSADEMFEHYRPRSPFSDWDQQVLRDYCDYGLLPNLGGDGYVLACPPVKEADCYTMHDDGRSIHAAVKKLRTPTILLRARSRRPEDKPFSFDPSPTWPKLAEQIESCRDYQYEDKSHFIPMEDPRLVADFVKELIS